MNHLKVKPYNENDKVVKPMQKGLVPPSWVHLSVGARGSGKTLSTLRYVEFYQNPKGKNIDPYFDDIFTINPSYYNDEKNEALNIPKENIFTTPSDDIIEAIDNEMKGRISEWKEEERYIEIWKKLMKYGENSLGDDELVLLIRNNFEPPDFPEHTKYPPHFLLILDDCASTSLMKQSVNNKFIPFLLKSRHVNCSIIINIQAFKHPGCPKIIRQNITTISIFKTHDQKSLSELWEELSGVMKKNDFLKLYKSACNKKYNFLFINLRDEDNKFRQNFNKVLTLDKVKDEDIKEFDEIER